MKYLIACTGALVVVAVVQSLAWTLSLKWWRRFVQGNREQRPNLGAYLLAWASSVGRHYTRWFSWPRKSDVEQQILKAGLSNLSYSTVVGAKVSFALLGIILGVMAGDFILAAVFGCIWFFVPDLYLSSLYRKRQGQVQQSLPRVIDLMLVATEAGLSFEGALGVVAGFADRGPLYREMGRVLQEIRLGTSQEQALRSLADRLDHPDVTSFVLTLIQGQKLGTSIGSILGVVAHQSRMKQSATAEGEAGKAPIKIMFPLLLFVFPSLLLVLLGPVFLGDGI